jgi:hypothetical protein
MPHYIQISQISPNQSTPARIGSDFRSLSFSRVSCLNETCLTSILLALTITLSSTYHESPLDHHRAARDPGHGRRRNSVFSNIEIVLTDGPVRTDQYITNATNQPPPISRTFLLLRKCSKKAYLELSTPTLSFHWKSRELLLEMHMIDDPNRRHLIFPVN